MKGIVSVLITGALVAGMYYSSPIYEQSKEHSAEVSLCERSDIYHSVNMKGIACSAKEAKVYTDSFAVVEQIYVRQGQQVKQGQELFTIRKDVSLDQARQAVQTGAQELLTILMEDASDGEISKENQTLLSKAVGNFQGTKETREESITITAPIDGTVMDIFCREGEAASPFVPCIGLADLSKMQVKAQVSEDNLSKLKNGHQATITFDALPNQQFHGTIDSIAPYAKAGSVLLQQQEVKTEVVIAVDNTQNLLRPGYSASAQVNVDERNQVLLLPYSSILQDNNGKEFVLAVGKNHTAIKLPIITGYELESQVEVLSGLTGEELIVKNPKIDLIGKKLRIQVNE